MLGRFKISPNGGGTALQRFLGRYGPRVKGYNEKNIFLNPLGCAVLAFLVKIAKIGVF